MAHIEAHGPKGATLPVSDDVVFKGIGASSACL